MILNQTPESAVVSATQAAEIWNMPWHARLKKLADALRPGVAQGPRSADGTVQTWLQRIRVAS